MKKSLLEIPLHSEKGHAYRFFERLPAMLSWMLLATPVVLSQISPRATIFFILAYLLMWFIRAIALNVRVLQGWKNTQNHQKYDWTKMLNDLEKRKISVRNPSWHAKNIARLEEYPVPVKPSEVIHTIMIAIYNESKEILEPTLKAVIDSNFDMKKVVLLIAYEERGGKETEELAAYIVSKYGRRFLHAEAIKHPMDMENEVIGKGGNITFAGRRHQKWLKQQGIDPQKVIVTTLDSDNRPHPNYLAALTYTYCLCPEPKFISFQPIAMYTNNIWDAPALMRVIATGNSFWNVILTMRPHLIRNFSSHAQSMEALIDTDFWSVRTIVEDGHQFWRTYFRYDGKHEVYPIYLPIYQDAVLAEGYRRTLRAQFIQVRRWAWGASDIAYVVKKGYLTRNKLPRYDLAAKLFRLMEGHLSWATAPIILTFSAFVPILFNPQDIAANQLPNIASRIQTLAMAGLAITMFLSFKALPPKPARYKHRRTVLMVLQWVLLPLTTIIYSATAALNSQARLFFGWYLDKFDVTEKAVKR
jgi:cellulose synthase/poly-beta-1,6-N-acetylglucosamine synthase-like glycosyltransferase